MRFLDACLGRPVDRPPLWLMRQAGRYLPEYRAVREKAGGFLALCKTPELAAEVTLQPVRRFGFDAAIVFSDILIAPEAMGARVAFEAGEGPRVEADPAALSDDPDPRERCPWLFETLRIVRRELPPETALIGFAGAPFTVACYCIEGETSRGFEKARAFMLARSEEAQALLGKLARFTARTLAAQVEAGAQALQLFDTWAHLLGPEDAHDLAVRPMDETIHELRRLLGARASEVPIICYGPVSVFREVVHSVDWRADLASLREVLPVVQGNLDPVVLLAGPELVRTRARAMLAAATRGPRGAAGYIANLGHGVHRDTPIASVEALVEEVRAWRA